MENRSPYRTCDQCGYEQPLINYDLVDSRNKYNMDRNPTCNKCEEDISRAARGLAPRVIKPRSMLSKAESAANLSRRRVKRIRAMPPWVNEEEIKKVYVRAGRATEKTGVQHHVDHIYPLNSKVVCGLHVPWNLQVLPWRQNIVKSNKVPGQKHALAFLDCGKFT